MNNGVLDASNKSDYYIGMSIPSRQSEYNPSYVVASETIVDYEDVPIQSQQLQQQQHHQQQQLQQQQQVAHAHAHALGNPYQYPQHPQQQPQWKRKKRQFSGGNGHVGDIKEEEEEDMDDSRSDELAEDEDDDTHMGDDIEEEEEEEEDEDDDDDDDHEEDDDGFISDEHEQDDDSEDEDEDLNGVPRGPQHHSQPHTLSHPHSGSSHHHTNTNGSAGLLKEGLDSNGNANANGNATNGMAFDEDAEFSQIQALHKQLQQQQRQLALQSQQLKQLKHQIKTGDSETDATGAVNDDDGDKLVTNTEYAKGLRAYHFDQEEQQQQQLHDDDDDEDEDDDARLNVQRTAVPTTDANDNYLNVNNDAQQFSDSDDGFPSFPTYAFDEQSGGSGGGGGYAPQILVQPSNTNLAIAPQHKVDHGNNLRPSKVKPQRLISPRTPNNPFSRSNSQSKSKTSHSSNSPRSSHPTSALTAVPQPQPPPQQQQPPQQSYMSASSPYIQHNRIGSSGSSSNSQRSKNSKSKSKKKHSKKAALIDPAFTPYDAQLIESPSAGKPLPSAPMMMDVSLVDGHRSKNLNKSSRSSRSNHSSQHSQSMSQPQAPPPQVSQAAAQAQPSPKYAKQSSKTRKTTKTDSMSRKSSVHDTVNVNANTHAHVAMNTMQPNVRPTSDRDVPRVTSPRSPMHSPPLSPANSAPMSPQRSQVSRRSRSYESRHSYSNATTGHQHKLNDIALPSTYYQSEYDGNVNKSPVSNMNHPNGAPPPPHATATAAAAANHNHHVSNGHVPAAQNPHMAANAMANVNGAKTKLAPGAAAAAGVGVGNVDLLSMPQFEFTEENLEIYNQKLQAQHALEKKLKNKGGVGRFALPSSNSSINHHHLHQHLHTHHHHHVALALAKNASMASIASGDAALENIIASPPTVPTFPFNNPSSGGGGGNTLSQKFQALSYLSGASTESQAMTKMFHPANRLQFSKFQHPETKARAAAGNHPNLNPNSVYSTAAALDPLDELDNMDVLNNYDKHKELGNGTDAYVYEVVDRRDKSHVAMKLTKRKSGRYKTEIHLLHQLRSCPYVVKLLNCLENDNVYVLILEHAPMSLESLLLQRCTKHPMQERVAKTILSQVLRGIRAIHNLGFAHKDIKPENILIFANRSERRLIAKVADFGFATRVAPEGCSSGGMSLESLPREKYLEFEKHARDRCGTPGFWPPELVTQLCHLKYGFRMDVFSAGVTLYRMLCNEMPFGIFETWKYTVDRDNQKKLCKVKPNWKVISWLQSNSKFTPVLSTRQLSDNVKDLLRSMLRIRPEQRATVDQCLQHDFFTKKTVKAHNSTNSNSNVTLSSSSRTQKPRRDLNSSPNLQQQQQQPQQQHHQRSGSKHNPKNGTNPHRPQYQNPANSASGTSSAASNHRYSTANTMNSGSKPRKKRSAANNGKHQRVSNKNKAKG
eukprot:CAMPEP_0202708236 /NCGR_PEP_ID=MMETSP1385-20130828/20479_1 /ASSEMBLY_ACC=CAM_ASM_000861 /TAXON_ID=933848 /ORGANISM="Elphidium margaritaceum" /LENGTH=1432 /DNA_ID=CAMNT_0049367165 /DNA_START=71 /DNA_END=4369 /DNA_ORIENTATION=+